MSNLQLGLIAFGIVLVAGVWIYNVVQERRARGRAEEAFGSRPPDALFDEAGERREPTIGAFSEVPPEERRVSLAALDETLPPLTRPGELEAEGAPAAEVSSRIDTVAVILADDPVMSEQLQPLLDSLSSNRTPTHVEGIVDEQWHPIETSPRRSWRELRVGLQLADRGGAVSEEDIDRFNRAIADFAATVNAVSQREAPAAAAARARELDQFCADADVEVVVNVVGQFGATFAIPRVKSLALDNGLSETASGGLVRYGSDSQPAFTIRPLDDGRAPPGAHYYSGLTFALDLPNVHEAPRAFDEMAQVAAVFAATLGGQLVDDNKRPLSDSGLASIRRSVEEISRDMESHGIAAGSLLARRLFRGQTPFPG
ncbi:MAG TPA: cell division protein ZipA C-terminal FtsZ-binding domain-containing protein [Usitatibacter sp.]|nr:cell division protein ZipA C-terminal FtsZ-binding domain-containing protein [Usitatibacter sp.]